MLCIMVLPSLCTRAAARQSATDLAPTNARGIPVAALPRREYDGFRNTVSIEQRIMITSR
jgi:hypothetical protein